jgi:predicted dehydrogenase
MPPEASIPPRLRLGMVGGGPGAFIGAVHRMAARLDDDYELVAAAPSSHAENALQGGRELRLANDRIYTDYRAMAQAEAKRPDGIEVVCIVVPNHLHFDVASAFLQAGIHVICDKPLTTNLADGQKLLALAKQHHCRFALTHNYSGYPLVRAAREMIGAGRLGDIRVIQVEYAQDWLALPLEESGQKQAAWRTDPAQSGPAGCLGDIGSHAAHLVEFVTAMRPSEISADLMHFVPGRRLDDHVQIQLRYANAGANANAITSGDTATGARGLLWASQVATGEENGLRLRIYGSQAALRWQQELPNELWFTELGKPAQKLTRGMAGLPASAAAATRIPAGHPEGFIEAFAQLYKDFAGDLRRHQRGQAVVDSLVPGLEDGVRSLEFIEATLQSHAHNAAWVPLHNIG